MNAIILAAGVGRRLAPYTEQRPKCLVEVGGRPLLDRYLEALAQLGIRRIVLVVGYKQEQIRMFLSQASRGLDIRYVVNDQFERGSIGSLWAARVELTDDSLIMDADVCFHPTLLQKLIESPWPNALLMDQTVRQSGEECMVIAKKGRVVALTKHPPNEYDEAGEGVGFLKVHMKDTEPLLRSVESRLKRNGWELEYEEALTDFFTEVPVGYEKIGGLPWIEIDFPEDLARAEREIVPRLPEGHSV